MSAFSSDFRYPLIHTGGNGNVSLQLKCSVLTEPDTCLLTKPRAGITVTLATESVRRVCGRGCEPAPTARSW